MEGGLKKRKIGAVIVHCMFKCVLQVYMRVCICVHIQARKKRKIGAVHGDCCLYGVRVMRT